MSLVSDTEDRARAVIGRILSARFEGASELRDQLKALRVSGGTPTMLDLETDPEASRAPLENGPIHVRALVENERGEVEGEILLWVTDGHISGLEQAWFSESVPESLPDLARIRVDPSDRS